MSASAAVAALDVLYGLAAAILVAGRDGMKRTEDDAGAVLTRSQATREKTARLLKKAGARSQAPEGSVDLAAVRASVRRAVVEDEVEKRVAARAAPDRMLRVPDVVKLTGLHRSSIYRLERQGDFPKRVPLTKKTVAWRASEVAAWIARRGREQA